MVHLVPCSHSGAPCDRDHTFHLGRGRPITLSWQVGEKEAIAAAAAWEGGATPLTLVAELPLGVSRKRLHGRDHGK